MTLAVVRSLGDSSRRLRWPQELEDFEQELVDEYALAMSPRGDRRARGSGPVGWLGDRARRWPATVNPHLFINWYTAVRESPVSRPWITHALGISPQAIREDRIPDGALATSGDVRRLCDLSGLAVGGAERYARPVGPGQQG